MKTIKVLSDKHWPIEILVDYWPGGLRINSWLKSSKDVAVLEITNWRFYFYQMMLCKGTDFLKAGYISAPYCSLLMAEPVKLYGFWYNVRRTKFKFRNWCNSAFERMGI